MALGDDPTPQYGAYGQRDARSQASRDRAEARKEGDGVTRQEVMELITKAFASLNIAGKGVSGDGTGFQWAISTTPASLKFTAVCNDDGTITITGTVS